MKKIRFVALAAIAVGLIGWRARIILRAPAETLGGVILRYRIDLDHPYQSGLASDAMLRRTVEVLQGRVDKLCRYGHADARGDDVEVQVADRAAEALPLIERLLPRSGLLEFKLVDDGSPLLKEIAARAGEHVLLSVEHDGWAEHESGAHHDDLYLRAFRLASLEEFAATLKLPEDRELAFEHVRLSDDEDPNHGEAWRSYLLVRRAEVTGDSITDAEVNWDPQTGRPEVSLTLDSDGARRFEAFTARAVGRKLAIVLEGRVQSAPVIETKIGGGRLRITMGGFGDPFQLQQEAKDLVAVLRVGSLPAPIALVDKRHVEP